MSFISIILVILEEEMNVSGSDLSVCFEEVQVFVSTAFMGGKKLMASCDLVSNLRDALKQ